jgi:hypothetical protein
MRAIQETVLQQSRAAKYDDADIAAGDVTATPWQLVHHLAV